MAERAGGWRVEGRAPTWEEGGFKRGRGGWGQGAAKTISEKEFQRSGHLGLISLPRKATSNAWNASYGIGTILRAQQALS